MMMKKILFFVVLLMTTVAVQAQTEHLKFMGIPLNGTITQFQSKLAAKGIKPDVTTSKSLPVGCRAFNGVFSGENADIYVYYNSKTNIVYRAKAVISCPDSHKGEQKQEEYWELIKAKYTDGLDSEGEQDGHPTYSLFLYNAKGDLLGDIGLYISNSGYSFIDDVWLHIDYTDGTNYTSNTIKNMDDL